MEVHYNQHNNLDGHFDFNHFKFSESSTLDFIKSLNYSTTQGPKPCIAARKTLSVSQCLHSVSSSNVKYIGIGEQTTQTTNFYDDFVSQPVDSNANYSSSYLDQQCNFSSSAAYNSKVASPYTSLATSPHTGQIYNYSGATTSYSSSQAHSQPSLVDPKFPSETFDIPDIRDQRLEFSYNNPGFLINHYNNCIPRFQGFQQPAQYLTNSHRVGSLVRYSTMDDPATTLTSAGSIGSEDSDDSLPLSQIASKRTASEAKVTKKTEKKKSRKRKKKDPNEPQKPVSAYALFFRDTQAAIKGQKPNASFGEVSKIVASMWDSLDVDAKENYKKRTETAKKEYLKKLAAYRASVISQQTPDEGLAESTEITEEALNEVIVKKPTGKRAKHATSPPEVPSSTPETDVANTVDEKPVTDPLPLDQIEQKTPYESNSNQGGLKGQTIQIPRSLLEQAANKPISITVTQMTGEPGNQTKKIIKVMLPEKELQKLQKMKQVQASPSDGMMRAHQTPQEVLPTLDEQGGEAQMTVADISAETDTGPICEAPQPVTICECNGCNNKAVVSPLWDNEYCSNQCVVNHCQDVFTAWVAARSGTY